MKTIHRLTDLEPYGVVPLTGEACGLSMRVLCDLTGQGAKTVRQAWGLPPWAELGEQWNSGQGDSKHVASVMLDHDAYMCLGVFALLNAGCRYVLRFMPRENVFEINRTLRRAVDVLLKRVQAEEDPDAARSADWKHERITAEEALRLASPAGMFHAGTLYGIEECDRDDWVKEWLESARLLGWTFRSYACRGTAGDRNRHVFSGRTE